MSYRNTRREFLRDLGMSWLAAPHWVAACCRPVGEWLLRVEILFLDFGLLFSLYTGYRISQAHASRWSQA